MLQGVFCVLNICEANINVLFLQSAGYVGREWYYVLFNV